MVFQFAIFQTWLPKILDGLVITLYASAICIAISCVWGVLVGCITYRKVKIISPILSGYVLFFRETPLMIQLYMLFFALPYIGIMWPAMVCGVLGICLNTGAYLSEIVRGALQSVERGQTEAALSLGFTETQALVHFVFPQAMKKVVEGLMNIISLTILNTSLLSIISIMELTFVSKEIAEKTFQPVTAYVTAGVIYFCIYLIVAAVKKLMERRNAKNVVIGRS